MRQRLPIRLVALVAVLVAAAACSGRRTGDTDNSPIIATVGNHAITDKAFRARLSEQPPFARARYQTVEKKKELLDTLIRSELLLQEARRRNLNDDPEVRAAVEGVLIHRLKRVYAEESDKKNPVPEAELRSYYDQHRSEFAKPARIRLSHIFLASPEKDARRAGLKAEAARLLQQIKAQEAAGKKQVLELTASKRSDDAATKATGGDLGYRTREELAQAWGGALAEAGFALETQNQVGDVVSTSKGLHLIKLLGRVDGYETPFTAARPRIESRLQIERRARGIDDLVAELRKKTNIHIDEKLLAETKLEPAPAPASLSESPVARKP